MDFSSTPIPEQTRHLKVGAFSSQDRHNTANSTTTAIRTLWQVIQIWIQDFPEHKSYNQKVNTWTSSYGGHYAPALIRYTMEKNQQLEQGILDNKTVIKIPFDTLGMTNACVDALTQIPYYPKVMHDSNYSFNPISDATYHQAIASYYSSTGCLSRLQFCHAATPTPDLGSKSSANDLCHSANTYCGKHVVHRAVSPHMDLFDMGFLDYQLPYPTSETYLGYLNQAHVQEALGVPINFTANSPTVAKAFAKTGDNAKGGFVEDLAHLLDSGVKVTLVYGDRDFTCNCMYSY
jgi:carboxypeptidase C (cathepsin A)